MNRMDTGDGSDDWNRLKRRNDYDIKYKEGIMNMKSIMDRDAT